MGRFSCLVVERKLVAREKQTAILGPGIYPRDEFFRYYISPLGCGSGSFPVVPYLIPNEWHLKNMDPLSTGKIPHEHRVLLFKVPMILFILPGIQKSLKRITCSIGIQKIF
jgi:hypothetical protein